MATHKEGLTWINRRTSQWRYGANGQDQWIQPISIYTAGEAILRGQPVSILTTGDTSYNPLSDDDNVVVLTDTTKHIKCLGLALEPAAKGSPVHVLTTGRFSFLASEAPTYGYYPSFVDANRGTMVYVAPSSGGAGKLTLDRNAAILGARNLIQLGYITNTNDSNLSLDMELQLEGDGRGPVDNTQYELQFGEETYISDSTPRVFAVSNDSVAAAMKFKLKIVRPVATWPTTGGAKFRKWFVIYSPLKAYFFIMGGSNTPGFLSTTQADSDRVNFITNQFCQTTENVYLYGASSTAPASWGTIAPYPANNEDLYNDAFPTGLERFGNTLKLAIASSGKTFITGQASSYFSLYGSPAHTRSGDGNSTDLSVDLTFLNGMTGGPIYFECDSALSDYFGLSTYLVQGATANAGKVLLADRRFPNRSNVAGIYIGPSRPGSPYTTSETGLFIKKGLLTSPASSYIPGARYFLGEYGKLTTSAGLAKYPESLVEIGTAKSDTQLLVDIASPATPKGGDYSIGAIKAIQQGVDIAEPGFLLMDGATYAQSAYPELYAVLCDIYGTGNITTGGVNFIVPDTPHPYFGNHYQIKATLYGYQPMASILNRLSFEGALPGSGPVTVSVDVTAFRDIGPMDGGYIPRANSLLPKLFVDTSVGDDGTGWKEIAPGFTVVNGTLYGYIWKVDSAGSGADATYTLTTDASAGSGIAYVTAYNTATLLTSKNYNIVVYKPEMFARYFDVGASTLNPVHYLPPTSKGVATYIDTSVSTQDLLVRGPTNIKNTLDFHIDSLAGGHAPHDACARIEVTAHGVLRTSNTQSVLNAFGIAGVSAGTNDVYLVNNAGTLEISTDATAGTTFAVIRASDFQTVSTRVAKDNIQPYTSSALDIINRTQVVSYNLKSDEERTTRVGFIAEDTNELMSGTKKNSMNLGTTVGLLLKAVQELSVENKKLRRKLSARQLRRRR